MSDILRRRIEAAEQATAKLAERVSALELVDLRAEVERQTTARHMADNSARIIAEVADETEERNQRLEARVATLQEEKWVLAAALNRLVFPDTLPEVEDCYCHMGTVNVGSPGDPEPGPCPLCVCEIHQQRHGNCAANAEAALRKVGALEESDAR